MYFVPHFGHVPVYETSIWTPCFQISAKTLHETSRPKKPLPGGTIMQAFISGARTGEKTIDTDLMVLYCM